MNKYVKKAVVPAVVCALLLIGSAAQADRPVRIAILARDSLKSTVRTLQGAKKVIKRKQPDAAFYSFLVADEAGRNLSIVDSLEKLQPTVILTVGSSATEFARTSFTDIPIVFSAVKYPVLSGFVASMNRSGNNLTGASLDIPIRVQFTYFKKIVPNLRKIGVLYSKNTADLIPQAKLVAHQAGCRLVPIAVNSFKELPHALDSLATAADGIWGIADPNLFDPRSTRYILLNTLRKGIPFMGFSRHVVESGALFALDFDYKAIGFQAGEAVNRIISGEKPRDIPITTADVIWFHYNEKTAAHIDITIPEELVAVAKEVYR